MSNVYLIQSISPKEKNNLQDVEKILSIGAVFIDTDVRDASFVVKTFVKKNFTKEEMLFLRLSIEGVIFTELEDGHFLRLYLKDKGYIR